MKTPTSVRASRRRLAGLTVGALTASLVLAPVVAVPAAAAPPAEENVVASGDNWTVTDLGSVYEIELELDEPLEIKSDAPTIEVDGVAVGFATESESGTTLTALTSDPAVADATTVEQGWFAEAGTTDEAAVPESACRRPSRRPPGLPAQRRRQPWRPWHPWRSSHHRKIGRAHV